MTPRAVQKVFRSRWLPPVTIIGAAALAFYPVLDAGYVQWDDSLLTGKLALRGFGIEHLRQILVPSGGAYQPVRDLYFSLIYSVSGLDPFGYHLVNWLLYLLVAWLAYRTAGTLTARAGIGSAPGKRIIPWLAALLFAVHPLHTEVVAWMQGNKDLLATAFMLGAFLCWEKYTRLETGGIGYYLGSLGLFLLALGSKPSAVSFPLTVLALDLILPAGREKARQNLGSRLFALLPRYLPLLIPATALTLYFVFVSGAISTARLTAENFLVLPSILARYYRLLLLPLGLIHRYPDPAFSSPADPAWWAGLLVSAGLIVTAWRVRRVRPLVTFGIAWFFVCWLPQSNIFPIAIRVADRYIFLSLFGMALAVADALFSAFESERRRLDIAVVGCALLALCLGVLSRQRSLVWHDGVRLWSDAVEHYPRHSYYHYGLAEAHLEQEDLDAARDSYARAAELAPGDARYWTSLAYTWKQSGDLAMAEKFYRRALELDSTSYFAANSLGNICSQTGRDSLALGYYRLALSLRPGDYMATYNLAALYRRLDNTGAADSLLGALENGALPQPVVLLQRGRDFVERGELDSAKIRFQRAVELDRNLMPAWAGLGQVYLRQDSTARALEIMRRVMEQSEPDWTLLNDIAVAYERLQQPDSALAYHRLAFRAEPDSVQSGVDLAVALNQRGERTEAIEILEQVLERHPDNFPALKNMGNWLTLEEHYSEAAVYYTRALAVNPGDANTHYSLGRIYLQYLGRPGDALVHLKESLRLAPNMPQAELVRQVIAKLEGGK